MDLRSRHLRQFLLPLRLLIAKVGVPVKKAVQILVLAPAGNRPLWDPHHPLFFHPLRSFKTDLRSQFL
jgi:hypothetical protein